MLQLRLVDPHGYLALHPQALAVATVGEAAAVEHHLRTVIAVADAAAPWAGPDYQPHDYTVRTTHLPEEPMTDRKLTQEELLAEARERFGDDPLKWAFQCPRCKDIANGEDFRAALNEHPRTHTRTGADVIASDIVGQECIGRTLGALDKRQTYSGRGCDWTAYGLFGGPWTIALPGGRTMHSFPLAPQSGAA